MRLIVLLIALLFPFLAVAQENNQVQTIELQSMRQIIGDMSGNAAHAGAMYAVQKTTFDALQKFWNEWCGKHPGCNLNEPEK